MTAPIQFIDRYAQAQDRKLTAKITWLRIVSGYWGWDKPLWRLSETFEQAEQRAWAHRSISKAAQVPCKVIVARLTPHLKTSRVRTSSFAYGTYHRRITLALEKMGMPQKRYGQKFNSYHRKEQS